MGEVLFFGQHLYKSSDFFVFMGDELYQVVLDRVKLVPNVQVRKSYFIPTETELDLPDVEGNTTYSGYDVHCSTAGEIIVGFDTRTERVKKWGFLP